MKVLSVVGARPQFIKAAPLCRALAVAGHEEVLVHTGQHYDQNMSAIFFKDMKIPDPKYNLGVGSGSHGRQTGEMLMRLEEVMLTERPDIALVFGDTNSTLAGAIAASKLQIRLAHVEAGLRSFNRSMPEEHNRILTDHCSDLLFCPSHVAVENLRAEGITEGVYEVGDLMYDALLAFGPVAERCSTILRDLALDSGSYFLATVHRPQNTDSPEVLRRLLLAFGDLGDTVVIPMHPRTRQVLVKADLQVPPNCLVTEPITYLDMLQLESNARAILTDSGGVQKEAYWLRIPCVTLREQTEWVETVQAGWNTLTRNDPDRILAAVRHGAPGATPVTLYGDGAAAGRIAAALSG
jgi:UDP-N-acetylglucosamine 2-epimerase